MMANKKTFKKTLLSAAFALTLLAACAPVDSPRPSPTITLLNATENPPTLLPVISTPTVVSQMPMFSIVNEWNIEYINDIAWSTDNTKFAITFLENNEGGVRLYDVASLQEVWSEDTGMAFRVAINPDGQSLAISPYFNSVQLRDIATGKVIVDFSNENNCEADLNILFSPDGDSIITALAGGGHGNPYETRIYIWNTVKEQCIGKFLEEEGWLSDISMSRDGRLIALSLGLLQGNESNLIHIWDISTKQKICEVPGRLVDFSPINNIFVTTNRASMEIELWDAESCTMGKRFGKNIQPDNLAFHPNGQLLASGGESIQIWDTYSGELVSELTGLPNGVEELSFSPDGRYLLSVSPGKKVGEKATLILWEVSPR
jgi:WD40 repeat protein